tara:strand:+ start:64 stop:477 length:414 start_codon:yes stop_codon:yes gene_type:complete
MKIKNIFIITGSLSFLLMVFPVFLASAVPSIFEFFAIDGFGEGILDNKEALAVFDTFILVMSFMGAAIILPIFAAVTIKDLEIQKKLSLIFGLMLLLVAMPDFIGIIIGIAHAPLEMMVINTLIILFLFYGWKKGKA